MLTASGSPLPPAGVTRFGPELSPGYCPELDVKFGAVIVGDSGLSHAFLAIGDTIIHAIWSDRPQKTQLIPEEMSATEAERIMGLCRWIPLGKAKFESQDVKKLALKALLSIQIPPRAEPGGSCVDYIVSALETLKKRRELREPALVLQEFKQAIKGLKW
ncbi:hypothetical protein DFJ43DRAFT_1059723, partial [Lentinula guzmanii]